MKKKVSFKKVFILLVCILVVVSVWATIVVAQSIDPIPPNPLPDNYNPYSFSDEVIWGQCNDWGGSLNLQSYSDLLAPAPACTITGACALSASFCLPYDPIDNRGVKDLPASQQIICHPRQVQEGNKRQANYLCEPGPTSPRDPVTGAPEPYPYGSPSGFFMPWPPPDGCYLNGKTYFQYDASCEKSCVPNTGASCDDGDSNTTSDFIQCDGGCRGSGGGIPPPPPPPPPPSANAPMGNFSLGVAQDTTGTLPASSYTDNYSGPVPQSNLDILFDLTVTGNCGASGDDDLERCEIQYRTDCTNNGSWDGATQYFYNAWNKDWDKKAFNRCSYSSAGTYTAKGEVTIIKNDNTSNTTVLTNTAQITVTGNIPPSATVDVTIGTTSPYGNYVLGSAPVNNVDVSLAGNITSDCGTSGDPNANKCSARYRVDCTRDGTWEGDFTYSNVSNETKGYLFDNICSYFGPNTYYIRGEMKITKNSDPASSVTVLEDVPVYVTSPETPAGASCTPTSATVETNQSVTINGNVTGTSPSCSWSGGGTPGTSSSCAPFTTTYTTSGTKTINLSVTAGGTTANCSSSITVNDPIILPLSYTLTAIRNGQGTITSDVAGINCGSMCMGVYDEGTAVVLTATPAPRWRFIEWLGDCTAAGNTCTVQVDGPRTVTAKFRPNTFYEEF